MSVAHIIKHSIVAMFLPGFVWYERLESRLAVCYRVVVDVYRVLHLLY